MLTSIFVDFSNDGTLLRELNIEYFTHFLVKFSLFSTAHYRDSFTFSGPNILLRTLISNSLNLSSSLRVKGQISNPYKIAHTIQFYLNLYNFKHETGSKSILN
jgi:hypothetical protein